MKLSMNEFAAICGEYLIDPAIALEDRDIVEAIKQNDRDAIRDYLESNF